LKKKQVDGYVANEKMATDTAEYPSSESIISHFLMVANPSLTMILE